MNRFNKFHCKLIKSKVKLTFRSYLIKANKMISKNNSESVI